MSGKLQLPSKGDSRLKLDTKPMNDLYFSKFAEIISKNRSKKHNKRAICCFPAIYCVATVAAQLLLPYLRVKRKRTVTSLMQNRVFSQKLHIQRVRLLIFICNLRMLTLVKRLRKQNKKITNNTRTESDTMRRNPRVVMNINFCIFQKLKSLFFSLVRTFCVLLAFKIC